MGMMELMGDIDFSKIGKALERVKVIQKEIELIRQANEVLMKIELSKLDDKSQYGKRIKQYQKDIKELKELKENMGDIEDMGEDIVKEKD